MDIHVDNLSKSFEDKKVFQGFSYVLKENKYTVIMGESGCGKTTLIRIIAGLDKNYDGLVKGIENKKISMVFQEDRLCENISAFANVCIVKDEYNKDDIKALFEKVGLQDSINKPVNELSGGMKRRVAIIRALYADYDILILDEPFKGLDADTRHKVVETIKEYNHDKTVIIVTHDLVDVEEFNAELIKL